MEEFHYQASELEDPRAHRMMNAVDPHSRPNIVPWPPVILVIAASAAVILGWAMPLPVIQGKLLLLFGWLLVVAGVWLDLWSIVTMRRARTNILPHRGASVLVTWGPFKLTRNPIYLANTILLVGLGVVLENYWFIVVMIVANVFVDRLAIRREEIHLAARFGQSWRDYSSRTPRWIL
jgi:protein-S-isoprenylcysteine O-methyltransferase Ste14